MDGSITHGVQTTLPHLEAIDAERALNDDKRRKRKEERKLKREARECNNPKIHTPKIPAAKFFLELPCDDECHV